MTNTEVFEADVLRVEGFGFIREKIYSTIGQPFTPAQLGINAFGLTMFPGITIVDDLGVFATES